MTNDQYASKQVQDRENLFRETLQGYGETTDDLNLILRLQSDFQEMNLPMREVNSPKARAYIQMMPLQR